jgi:hypothetical protein
MTCRKQTVKEALAAASRSKKRALTRVETRVISVAAKNTPVLLCGPTRRLEGAYAGVRYPRAGSIREVKVRGRGRR